MTTPDEEKVTPGSIGVLALLTGLNTLNFVDRQLLASFANFIKPDLGLSDSQFGLLTGLVFIFFYAIMGLFTGALADMVHRPRLIAAGLGLWSALTAASGAARGFVTLAIPRMFIGVGESVLTPASMSILADRMPVRHLGLAAGIYYLGVPLGAGASLLIAGYLGPAIGWRNCFYALGAIGVVVAIGMLAMRETPRRGVAGAGESTPRQSFGDLMRQLASALRASPALAFTMAGGVALHFGIGAAQFDQLWFVEERGFERARIAQITGAIFIVGGAFGNLAGGYLGDLWLRVTGQGRPMFLFVLMLALAPLQIAYRLVEPESAWFWIGIFAGIFQLTAFYGPTFSTIQELSPPRARSTVVAFYILGLNLVGLGIGVTAGGIAIDWMRSAGIDQPYTWTLVSFTVLSGLAIPCFLIAGLRFDRDRARLAQEFE